MTLLKLINAVVDNDNDTSDEYNLNDIKENDYYEIDCGIINYTAIATIMMVGSKMTMLKIMTMKRTVMMEK